MSASTLIDILIAAVLALSLYLGWRKGIVRGLLALAASIVAIIAASWIADYTSDILIEQVIRPATQSAIEQRISELDLENLAIAPMEEIERVINGIENPFIREKTLSLLASADLPIELLEDTAQEAVLTISNELVDSVLYGAVRALVCAIICILCFLLISLALRPVQALIEQAFELPILKQVNQIGGLISGAVKGVLLVLVVVWALHTAQLYITDDIIEASYLLKLSVTCLESLGFFSLFPV